ncbi:MAG: Inorganic pyrophosphatase [Erysipelotrichaceae bacterium]
MNKFENNAYFWQKLDTLLLSSNLPIERAKGSAHPKYSHLYYPLDFGKITDGSHEISYYKGSHGDSCESLVVAVDILSKEVMVNLLLGCDDEEIDAVLRFLNQTAFQKTIFVGRGDEVPAWATEE